MRACIAWRRPRLIDLIVADLTSPQMTAMMMALLDKAEDNYDLAEAIVSGQRSLTEVQRKRIVRVVAGALAVYEHFGKVNQSAAIRIVRLAVKIHVASDFTIGLAACIQTADQEEAAGHLRALLDEWTEMPEPVSADDT